MRSFITLVFVTAAVVVSAVFIALLWIGSVPEPEEDEPHVFHYNTVEWLEAERELEQYDEDAMAWESLLLMMDVGVLPEHRGNLFNYEPGTWIDDEAAELLMSAELPEPQDPDLGPLER